jgi:hypothetical protein
VAPDDTSFMSVLAEQYARQRPARRRREDAGTHAGRAGQDLTGHILRTRIEITQQRAYAAQPESPERTERLAQMKELLAQAAAPETMRRWTLADLQTLGTQSRQIGDAEAANVLFRALGARSCQSDFYNRQLASIALAGGNYRDASQALFDAQARSKTCTSSARCSCRRCRRCSRAICWTKRSPKRSAAAASCSMTRTCCAI